MFKRRSTLRSPQLAKKKKKQLWIKSSAGVFLLLVVLIVPPILSHLPALTIHTIDIEGNEVITHGELDGYVREKISGNYLGVFSKSNILLYPRAKIEAEILRDFPRLQSAQVFFKSLKSIGVVVEERKPFAVWCKSVLEAEHPILTDECYFMNQDGLVFTKAPQFSGNVYVRYYGRLATTEPVFEQYFPPEQFKNISHFISSVNKLGFLIIDVLAYDDGDLELRTDNGGEISLTIRNDFVLTLENLQSLLGDKISVPDKDDFIKNLDYVDLRFGKKLFFKLK